AQHKPFHTTEDALMKLVTSTIAPRTWSASGGPGVVQYHSASMALVVTQTPEVQEKVAQLLNDLRKLQDLEVALEIRFITVTDKCFARVSKQLGLEPKMLHVGEIRET